MSFCQMSRRLPVFALALLLFQPIASPAADNAYDVLGKVLMPFVGVLAEKSKGDRAVTMSLRLEEAPGWPAEALGSTVELSLENPDRLRVSGPLLGQSITLCRRGQTIWVYPGSTLQRMLATPEIASRLPAPNREYKLSSFRLPIPAKQLVFLPALFKAQPAEPATIDGATYAGYDYRLAPELSRALKGGEWAAQVWVDEKSNLQRIAIGQDERRVVLRVERLRFRKTLPPETWAPTEAETPDVLLVPPARYDQLFRALVGEGLK